MSISANMFLKLFNSECSVGLSKRFFPAFASIIKLQKRKSKFFRYERHPKVFSNACAAALYNLKIVAILLANWKVTRIPSF